MALQLCGIVYEKGGEGKEKVEQTGRLASWRVGGRLVYQGAKLGMAACDGGLGLAGE